MRRALIFSLIVGLLTVVVQMEILARGGGGRGGGGGGGRGGGGFSGGGGGMRAGGGFSPSGGMSRGPSMGARPAPRPSPGGGARPGGGSVAGPDPAEVQPEEPDPVVRQVQVRGPAGLVLVAVLVRALPAPVADCQDKVLESGSDLVDQVEI